MSGASSSSATQLRSIVAKPAVGQVGGRALHEPLGQLVGLEAGVAIGPSFLRRDDVRGIARDQVEGLSGHRLEEAPARRLDVVEPVERSVQLLCTRAHAGSRQWRRRAARGAPRTAPARRFPVPTSSARPTRWRGVRASHTRDVGVGRDVVRWLVSRRVVVGRDEELADGEDATARRHLVADVGERGGVEGARRRPARPRRPCARRRGWRNRSLTRVSTCVLDKPALEHGDVLTVAGVRIVAEQVDDRLLGVAGVREPRPTARCAGCGDGLAIDAVEC